MEDVQERNREVLDAVRVRRDALYEGLLGLEQALAAPSADQPIEWCRPVRARVVELRRVLEAHVRETESDGGFFEDVREHAPQLLRAIEDVQDEHPSLLAALTDLDREVDAVADSGDVAAVRAAGLELLNRILVHRHRGAELVYDAYSVDISAAD